MLIHEFGHAFANLADEYVPATLSRGSENCKSSCDKFNSEIDGCFQGCSKANYYRSIQNGLMRTLSNTNYGIYNKNLIRELINKRLGSHLTGNAINSINPINTCLEQKYAFLEVQNKNGRPYVLNKQVFSGCAPNYNSPSGNINYKIYNKQGNLISEKNTNLMIFTDTSLKQNQIVGKTYRGGINNSFILITKLTSETQKVVITDEDTGNSTSENLQNFGGETACHL